MKMQRVYMVLISAILVLTVNCSHEMTPEEARIEIGRLNLVFTDAGFVDVCNAGDIFAIKLFLKAGMKPNVSDSSGRPTHSFTSIEPSSTMAIGISVKDDFRRRGIEIAKYGPRGATPLMVAAVNSRDEAVKLLLDSGSDPNVSDDYGNSALSYAAWKGALKAADYLVSAGADLKGGTNKDHALTIACLHNQVQMAAFLLDHGADMTLLYQNERTPLMIAASNGNVDLVKLLLDRGADPNAYGESKRNALITLICSRSTNRSNRPEYLSIAKLLIEKGTEVNAKDYQGYTALRYATSYPPDPGDQVFADLLRASGAK